MITIILCTLSFVYYFYDIISDYFQYRTYSQFSYFFSVSYPTNSFNESNEEIFSNRLKINGKRIDIDTRSTRIGKRVFGREIVTYDIKFKNMFQYGEDLVFTISRRK